MPATTSLPKTLGACIDKMYAIKLKREALAEEDRKLEEDFDLLKKHVMEVHLPKGELNGAAGKLAKVNINYSDVPTGIDWEKLRAYVVKTKSWDLFTKHLNNAAFRERWAQKMVVPGVQIMRVTKLSVTKR